MDLDPVAVEVLETLEAGERQRELLASIDEHFSQIQRLLHRRLDLVEVEEVGHLLRVVDDIVELRRQPVDVLAIEGRDEGRVQALDDVVGDPVALLLSEQDLPAEPVLAVGPAVEHVA